MQSVVRSGDRERKERQTSGHGESREYSKQMVEETGITVTVGSRSSSVWDLIDLRTKQYQQEE